MANANYSLIGLETAQRWHSLTIRAIRTGRFRENQLELMPGFKPIIEVIEARMQGSPVDQHLQLRTDVAFGRPKHNLIVKSANEMLTSPPEIFTQKEPSKERDSKNSKKASLHSV